MHVWYVNQLDILYLLFPIVTEFLFTDEETAVNNNMYVLPILGIANNDLVHIMFIFSYKLNNGSCVLTHFIIGCYVTPAKCH